MVTATRQHFQRDRAIELHLAREVDLAHFTHRWICLFYLANPAGGRGISRCIPARASLSVRLDATSNLSMSSSLSPSASVSEHVVAFGELVPNALMIPVRALGAESPVEVWTA